MVKCPELVVVVPKELVVSPFNPNDSTFINVATAGSQLTENCELKMFLKLFALIGTSTSVFFVPCLLVEYIDAEEPLYIQKAPFSLSSRRPPTTADCPSLDILHITAPAPT